MKHIIIKRTQVELKLHKSSHFQRSLFNKKYLQY